MKTTSPTMRNFVYLDNLSPSSLQSSPSPGYGLELLPPAPLELPESAISPRGGLIRKLSHGAKSVGREFTTQIRRNHSKRAESSGPVVRRRSDSKNANNNNSNNSVADPDLGSPDLSPGLGLMIGFAEDVDTNIMTEVVAPAIPAELVAGCLLTKSTQKKRVEKYFFIDAEGTRVSWSGRVSMKSFHIDNVKSIRTNSDAECAFTINYVPSNSSNDVKTLHLIAHSKENLSLWVDTLEALSKHREDLMTGMMGFTERQSVLRAHWDAEIKKVVQRGQSIATNLTLPAITSLCRKLHIHCPKEAIAEAFERADDRRIGSLEFEQFRKFVRFLRERKDMIPIFNELRASNVRGIERSTFLRFLRDTQGIDTTTRELADYVDFDSFAAFLCSTDCYIYTTERSRSMLTRPINEYFISSSHNTYLLGRQVNGTSSVEAYVTALRRGCRSVEIDCWDGDNNNPRVTHGFTRTTSVNFDEVCHAINRCAFDASPYPVILSLEVHCNPAQQLRMVQILNTAFGDRLVTSLLSKHVNDLPSPEELKYRILVKVKATEAHPNLNLTPEPTISRKRSTSSPNRTSESLYSPTDRSGTATSASDDDDSDTNVTSPVTSESSSRNVKTSKIVPLLAALGTYFQGYTFRSPRDLTFPLFNHIFSLNENVAIDLCKEPTVKRIFEMHNVQHMCRVYPKNLRVNSSNFDPNTFWRRGVQMVALNHQTYDTHMQMHQAMFAAGTDQTGYVLKPDYLRRITGPRSKLPRCDIRFSVKIISAQQLPRPASMNKNDSIDPFVEVQMFSAEDKARGIANGTGGQGPSSTKEYHGIGSPYTRRTKVIRGNGYNPQFNDLIELSLQTKYPELVFVRFIVYQAGKNSRQLAVFTSKLSSLQRGYRHIPLYNSHGEELIFSTLFCKITKEPVFSSATLQDELDRTPRQSAFRAMLSRTLSVERGRERILPD